MILGFDIRIVDGPGIAARWDESRRARYLLRPEVPWVASVDSAVFPSPFDFGNRLNDPDSASVVLRLSPRDVHQQSVGLWSDLEEMDHAFARQELPDGTVCMRTAIVVCSDDFPITQRPWDDLADEPTSPGIVNPEWRLLGYDVATPFLLSGLSNCGYHAGEKASLALEWADTLNHVGLCRDLGDAGQFRDVTTRRLPQHAPFLVFGLYDLGRDVQEAGGRAS